MRNALFALLISLCLCSTSAKAEDPTLASGDIIFQTSSSRQSYAIMWASKSLYSHVGVIEVSGNKKYVIEAISKVSRTPLEKWIQRGRLGRYAVYRYEGLSPEKANSVVAAAKGLMGRPYDIYFTGKNQEIYCSELVEMVFEKAGLKIGKTEKVKELDVDNAVVRKLVEKRWRKHPVCKNKVQTFDDCWSKILEDELISPEGLTRDPYLKKIWSNYI